MHKLVEALFTRLLGSQWRAVKLGPRLATVGARPTDKARLFLLGAMLPLLERRNLLERRRAHVRVRLQDSVVPIVLGDASDYTVLAATRAGDDMIPDFLRSPKVIVDCGAHIGTVALQYRARFPDATIYAVEPDPSTVERLRYNLGPAPNTTIVRAAVGAKTGSTAFFPSTHSWSSALTASPYDPVLGHTVVASLTLSDLLDRCSISDVDLLKLDIEGAELDVLGDLGLSRVRAIVAEIHYDLGGFTEQDLMERLNGFFTKVVPLSRDRALLLANRSAPVS